MYVRKYNWPAEAKDPDFRFGAIDKSSAKGEAGGVKGKSFFCTSSSIMIIMAATYSSTSSSNAYENSWW